MGDIAVATLRNREVSEEAISLAKKIAVSFDPCLSCSVHALKVKIVKS